MYMIFIVYDRCSFPQLVTSVPSESLVLPWKLSLAAADKQEIELNERQPEPEEETVDDLTPRGQILWIRGLTRLQHQVCRVATTSNVLARCSHVWRSSGLLTVCGLC